jgi:hypothetical protein
MPFYENTTAAPKATAEIFSDIFKCGIAWKLK